MKKRRNKSYAGPKFVSLNPMADIFGGLSDTHAPHLQVCLMKNHAAMAAIVTGHGTKAHFDTLVGAMNTGNVMTEMGIGDEFRADMIAGRDALHAVGRRWVATQRFVFTGDELKAMNTALACHDAQLENIRAIDVERASQEVFRRLRNRVNTIKILPQGERA